MKGSRVWVGGREMIMAKSKPYFLSNSRGNIKWFQSLGGWVGDANDKIKVILLFSQFYS